MSIPMALTGVMSSYCFGVCTEAGRIKNQEHAAQPLAAPQLVAPPLGRSGVTPMDPSARHCLPYGI